MSDSRKWLYDEFKQIGTDFSSQETVEAYDQMMQKIRDMKLEAEDIFSRIQIDDSSSVIEIGCGTSEFALAAAERCARVYAVDISQAMLDYSRRKTEARGVDNIEFIRGGFLTYEHSGEPVDAVVSQIALHHLPDFWKAVALRNVWNMLKDGGRFYLRDTVFACGLDNYAETFDNWIADSAESAGEMVRSVTGHIREEFSTWDWIMEGLLKQAGFTIESADYHNNLLAIYVCVK